MLLSWSLWFHFFLILIFRKTTRDVVEWKIRCEFLSEKLFLICTRNNVFGKNCFGFGFSNCCQQTTVFAARYLFFGNQVIICFIWNISFRWDSSCKEDTNLIPKRKILGDPKLATGVWWTHAFKHCAKQLENFLRFSLNCLSCFNCPWLYCLFNISMFYSTPLLTSVWNTSEFYIAWEPFWFKGGLWWDHSCICTRRWPTQTVSSFPTLFLRFYVYSLALSLRARAHRMIPNCVG